MRRITLLLCLLSMVCSTAYMQNSHTISTMVKGEVCDTLTQERLINAVVQFLSVTDTTQQFVAVTDVQGHFLQPLHPGIYNIRISYITYLLHGEYLPGHTTTNRSAREHTRYRTALHWFIRLCTERSYSSGTETICSLRWTKNALQSKCSSIGAR